MAEVQKMKLLLSIISIVLCLGILFLAACAPSSTAGRVAVLPSATSTVTASVTPTLTLILTQTATPTETPEPTYTPVTELYLRLKNAEGEPVPFSNAELFMEAWMITDSLKLTTEGNLLMLSLEEDSVRSYWLEHAQDRIAQHSWHDYLLYIEADGYVPVLSRPMYFVGTETWVDGPATQVVVEFPNGPKAEVSRGETQEIELTLREPQSRYLRFVDDNQMPVPRVEVKSYMYWSSANRCGVLMGANFLAEGISDEDGRISIPDGEFEYALEFQKPFYYLKEPVYGYPMRLITYLSGQETVVELHKLRRQPLEMSVRKNGEPLANETLFGQWNGCACCARWQHIATTDENGRISLEYFYPEEWDFIAFLDEEGEFAWDADPKQFSGTEIIQVELHD